MVPREELTSRPWQFSGLPGSGVFVFNSLMSKVEGQKSMKAGNHGLWNSGLWTLDFGLWILNFTTGQEGQHA
ncbi:MAG: hypothetical protein VR69_03015 [Peptococcaceae bacterium BRH_c4b]|nr:MAG: hypothetical protein VR69_03015 [Peptococcaceae bacterium BRH_c4b]